MTQLQKRPAVPANRTLDELGDKVQRGLKKSEAVFAMPTTGLSSMACEQPMDLAKERRR